MSEYFIKINETSFKKLSGTFSFIMFFLYNLSSFLISPSIFLLILTRFPFTACFSSSQYFFFPPLSLSLSLILSLSTCLTRFRSFPGPAFQTSIYFSLSLSRPLSRIKVTFRKKKPLTNF